MPAANGVISGIEGYSDSDSKLRQFVATRARASRSTNEWLSIKEIVRRTGHGRNTVRRALRSGEAPRYRRPPRPSKLDPFREEVHRLLRADPRLPGTRVRELLEEQGYDGGKTILDDYLREVRPLFLARGP
jgi:transposase